MSDKTIYLKLEQITEVYKPDVYLRDIAEVHCCDSELEQAVASLKIVTFASAGNRKRDAAVYVGDVMDLLAPLEAINKTMKFVNMGETEFVIRYRPVPRERMSFQWGKTALIAIISFCGAAFAIMTFNNDASVNDVFGKLYYLITGTSSNGFTILEISYSCGLAIGILMFFNHFASWKLTVDPTPIEVEMRLYETNVNKAVIQNEKRKEQGIDVF